MKCLPLLASAVLLFAGCSSVQIQKGSKTALTRRQRVYVEQRTNDSASLDARIVNELKTLGYDASAGPLTMMPDDTELVVTYDARWEWDFRHYLIDLGVTVRPASSFDVLARARYFHPGVTRKPPEEMIHELLAPLFRRK